MNKQDIDEALSKLHGINVCIDAYINGLDWDGRKIDLTKVSNQLMKVRKGLEQIRVRD